MARRGGNVSWCAGVDVAPWKFDPPNDDWTSAPIAQNLADHGVLKFNTTVAANPIGQSFNAAPVIDVFGSSFFALRSLPMALAVLLLWLVDRPW